NYGNQIISPSIEYDNIPIGFFGYDDAVSSQMYSNALLMNGFRSSLPLGTIVLNKQNIMKLIEASGWDTEIVERAKIDISTIDGEIALQIRLSGIPDRICTFLSTINISPNPESM